ncbi:hypothetical protein MRX96_004567 [Rhipicephalus microplus]
MLPDPLASATRCLIGRPAASKASGKSARVAQCVTVSRRLCHCVLPGTVGVRRATGDMLSTRQVSAAACALQCTAASWLLVGSDTAAGKTTQWWTAPISDH